MKQGDLFTKTRREAPAGETSKSAQLLIRAGFIHKEMSGVYSMLPLGLRVLKNIENVIREEMEALGATEIEMTSLQDPTVWQASNRWDDQVLDVWFKTDLKNGTTLGLSTTHEEPITRMMKDHISSYKDLPVFVYQFQKKFRNELRAKSGIIRGREFLMKDLYSFCKDENEQQEFYEKAKQAYLNIFEKVGLGDITYLTKASGGTFAEFSDEFQTICDAGEDLIYFDEKKGFAINKEILSDDLLTKLGMDKNNLKELKTAEVGNIFNLGTRYSDALELFYTDENDERKPVIMGSYGIGLGRLMGVIAENFANNDSLTWPKNIAPYNAHVLQMTFDGESNKKVHELEKLLKDARMTYLTDDRDKNAGEKFHDAELIGIPNWIIVGKEVANSNHFIVRQRHFGKDDVEHKVPLEQVTDLIG